MTPTQRLQQLRQLAEGSLSRASATRQRDPRSGDYATGATLRDVVEELRIELDGLVEALTEWEDADEADARRDARSNAEGAAGNVVAELSHLGVIAPTMGDGRRSAADVVVERVTRQVRTTCERPAEDEGLTEVVRAALAAVGYLPA